MIVFVMKDSCIVIFVTSPPGQEQVVLRGGAWSTRLFSKRWLQFIEHTLCFSSWIKRCYRIGLEDNPPKSGGVFLVLQLWRKGYSWKAADIVHSNPGSVQSHYTLEICGQT